jgi:hypothetical protein
MMLKSEILEIGVSQMHSVAVGSQLPRPRDFLRIQIGSRVEHCDSAILPHRFSLRCREYTVA